MRCEPWILTPEVDLLGTRWLARDKSSLLCKPFSCTDRTPRPPNMHYAIQTFLTGTSIHDQGNDEPVGRERL